MKDFKFTITVMALALGAFGGYYFGYDRGYEKAANVQGVKTPVAEDSIAMDVLNKITGLWRSVDDSRFTREFRSDGTVADRYEGDEAATAGGVWNLFTKDVPDPGFEGNLEDDAVYVKIIMDGQNFHYKVDKLTASELEMPYLDRGGVLKFIKVK